MTLPSPRAKDPATLSHIATHTGSVASAYRAITGMERDGATPPQMPDAGLGLGAGKDSDEH